MQNYRCIFRPVFVLAFCLFLSLAVTAQQVEPNPFDQSESYDVLLQVIAPAVAGNEQKDLPKELADLSRRVKADFGISRLRPVYTLFARVSDKGSINNKGISFNETAAFPDFLEWQLMSVRSEKSSSGKRILRTKGFRFGAKLPLNLSRSKDVGSIAPAQYEQIGLTLGELNLQEGVPVLVGMLNGPEGNDQLFLVLSIKIAENR